MDNLNNRERASTFSAETERTRLGMMEALDAYINSRDLPEEGREKLREKLKDLHLKLEDIFEEIERLSSK